MTYLKLSDQGLVDAGSLFGTSEGLLEILVRSYLSNWFEYELLNLEWQLKLVHHLQSNSREIQSFDILICPISNWTRLWLSPWSPWTESWDNNIWWYYIFNDDRLPMYYNGGLDWYNVFCKWCSWLIDELGIFYSVSHHWKFFHVESGELWAKTVHV